MLLSQSPLISERKVGEHCFHSFKAERAMFLSATFNRSAVIQDPEFVTSAAILIGTNQRQIIFIKNTLNTLKKHLSTYLSKYCLLVV